MTRQMGIIAFCLLVPLGASFSADSGKKSEPVARIGDTVITESDMREALGMALFQAENTLYQTKRGWIDERVRDILFEREAKETKLSRFEWEAREIAARVAQPTQEEINAMLQRVPAEQSASTETLRRVTEYLSAQKRSSREEELYQQLSSKYSAKILLEEPSAPNIVPTYAADDPVKGPKDAAVTILEFTDFQCPWCQRSQEFVKRVEQKYKDKVRFVSRQFPLIRIHPRAKPAAEAALCAREQGKFWVFHEKLFEKQQLEDADFTRYAREAGLDKSQFEKCVKDHKYAARVDKDLLDGQRFGVQGTPTFFVNGQSVGFNNLEASVEQELAKAKAAPSK
ncbi:MAG: thioredoxin domain-containing protein [Elusimicrobia bacterium]|nr:thioredoxin domain-containing protein [Elusimicrobiota bacterium]